MIVYLMGKNMDIKDAKEKYNSQKRRAKARNIGFFLTFEQWKDIWIASGKWGQRGVGRGKYNMSRIGDTGPYAVNNVFIQSHDDNLSDAHKGKTISIENRRNNSIFMKGNTYGSKNKGIPKPKIMCPHCNKMGAPNLMPRYHFDNCKRKIA